MAASGAVILVTDNNCKVKDPWAFPYNSIVIFEHDVDIQAGGCILFNMESAATNVEANDYCDRDHNGVNSWTGTEAAPKHDAQPVVFRGNLKMVNNTGLMAPQTTIYQVGGHWTSRQLLCIGLHLTAPIWMSRAMSLRLFPVTPHAMSLRPMLASNPASRTSAWDSFSGDTAGGSTANGLGGQAGLFVEGIWYLPNSQFDYTGDATSKQRHAQFVAKRLNVVGGGEAHNHGPGRAKAAAEPSRGGRADPLITLTSPVGV